MFLKIKRMLKLFFDCPPKRSYSSCYQSGPSHLLSIFSMTKNGNIGFGINISNKTRLLVDHSSQSTFMFR